MIVYQKSKRGFLNDVHKHDIEKAVLSRFMAVSGHRVGKNEILAWKSSLTEMAKVLNGSEIPEDCGVAIEYFIPQTSKRVDMLVSGINDRDRETLVIVELKQWQTATATRHDGLVRTHFAHGEQETTHPSYQAASYADLLRNFNEAVYEPDVPLVPCAYLHNCEDLSVLEDPFYARYTDRAPLFGAGEEERVRLRRFLARHLRRGERGQLIIRIDNGRIRPSKRLVDALLGMLDGKPEFVLVDDQKVVYENARSAARAGADRKKVVIVDGGPGTGKSVVAINLLAALTAERKLARYVTKNAAPRAVFEEKLSGSYKQSKISALFGGSGAFVDCPANFYDVLVVDEAHRLNEKSGLYGNLGENQIAEITRAARCSIFFLDEDQRVTWKDIGDRKVIEHFARASGAEVVHLALKSQFRCAGSDGYLAWLDNVLGIRPTANPLLGKEEFDFRVVDSPETLRRMIVERNSDANRARMVAGYCWDWKSKKNPEAFDVVIPEHGFQMQWNLGEDGGRWIIAKDSVAQVGCIHTCQGLEVDYVGVIIGPDLICRDGEIVPQPKARSRQDQSLKGYKAMRQMDPEGAERKAAAIIRNTYRTLLTRGMKGCYVYCTDTALAEHLRSFLLYPNTGSTPMLEAADGEKGA